MITDMLDDISDLIDEFGREMTLTQVTLGGRSPGTPRSETSLASTITAATVRDFKFPSASGTIQTKGTAVIIKAKDITVIPNMNNLIEDDGITYTISKVHRIKKQTTTIAYVCETKG